MVKIARSTPYRVATGVVIAALLVVGSVHTLHNPFRRTIRARRHCGARITVMQQAFSVGVVDANDVDHTHAPTVAVDQRDLTVPFVNKVRIVSRARRMAFAPPPIRHLKLPSSSDDACALL